MMGNSTPRVSVVIPAYNHEAYVGAAIESVLDQSLGDFELIVIDDGSADATARVAEEFAAKDSRITVYRQENQGTAATLNRGLGLARAAFTAILNSDDRFHPERLARLVERLEGEPGAGLAVSGLRLIDPAGQPIQEGGTFDWLAASWAFFRETGDLVAGLMRDNFVCTTSNLVFRTALAREMGGFAPLTYVNDLDFLLRILARAGCLVVDEALLDYRLHPANTIKERKQQRAEFRYEMAWALADALSDPRLVAKTDAALLARVLADTRHYNLDAVALATFMTLFKALPRERWAGLLAPEGRIASLLAGIEVNRAREDHFAWLEAEHAALKSAETESQARLVALAAKLQAVETELKAERDTALAGRDALRREIEEIHRSRGFRLLCLRHTIKSPRDLPRVMREALAIVLPERWKAAWHGLLHRDWRFDDARRKLREAAGRLRRRLTPPVRFRQSVHEGPLVTVIVPCFNDGRWLDRLFASLAAQTFTNFEVILVDDGSTDGFTRNRISELEAAPPPGLTVIRQENQGVIAARNAALALARGRYVFPLDADDAVDKTFLEKCLLLLENSGPRTFVYTWTFSLGENCFIWPTADSDPLAILEQNRIGFVVFPRAAVAELGGYDPAMHDGYEDWELAVRLVAGGYVGRAVPEPLYFYHVRHGSRNFHATKKHAELARRINNLHRPNIEARLPALRRQGRKIFKVDNPLVNLTAGMSRPDNALSLDLRGSGFDPARVFRDALALGRSGRAFLFLAVEPRWRAFFDANHAPGLAVFCPDHYAPGVPAGWFLEYARTAHGAAPLDLERLASAGREPGPESGRTGILYVAPWLITGGSDQMTVDWFRELPGGEFDKYLVLTEPRDDVWLPKLKGFAREVYDLPDLGIDTAAGAEAFILELLERRRIRVVHVMHSAKGYAALPAVKRTHPDVRTVAQFHCFDILEDGRPGGYPLDVPQRVGSVVDAYDVVSEDLAQGLRAQHPHLDAGKISVNRCVIDTAAFDPACLEPDPAIMSRRADGALNVLFVGRLDAQKNPLRMAAVALGLREAGRPAVFRVIGGGTLASQEQELKKFLAANGLGGTVVLHGVQPRESMPSWYAMADVLLLTSDWEGVPVVLFEAMATGLPVVAPRIGGIAELVLPGTGVLIEDKSDVGAYVRALLDLADPERRRAMGVRARAVVTGNCDIGGLGERYRGFYRTLLGAEK
jgi:glycosyltransferase involved in cell wall biosynthesis